MGFNTPPRPPRKEAPRFPPHHLTLHPPLQHAHPQHLLAASLGGSGHPPSRTLGIPPPRRCQRPHIPQGRILLGAAARGGEASWVPNRGSPQPPRLRPRSLVLIKTGARPLRSCRPGPRCRSGPFGAAGEALGCQQLSRGVKRGGGRLHSGVRSPPRSHSAPPRLAPSSDVHRGVTHLAAGATPVRAPTGPWGCWCLPPPAMPGVHYVAGANYPPAPGHPVAAGGRGARRRQG